MFVFAALLSLIFVSQDIAPTRSTTATSVEPLNSLPQADKPYKVKMRFGSWYLDVRRDKFASETTCTISAPGMVLYHGALIVRFPSKANTFAAVYRVDGGPKFDVRSDVLNLARLGLPVYQDDLTNPSGGLVRIPSDRIEGAQHVQIELLRGGRVYTRSLIGLDQALAEARQNNCMQTSRSSLGEPAVPGRVSIKHGDAGGKN